MRLGKVIGNVVSTKKHASLVGGKFMKVELESKEIIVSMDQIGAGLGDMVIVTEGHNARYAYEGSFERPIDSVIVGIVDDLK